MRINDYLDEGEEWKNWWSTSEDDNMMSQHFEKVDKDTWKHIEYVLKMEFSSYPMVDWKMFEDFLDYHFKDSDASLESK